MGVMPRESPNAASRGLDSLLQCFPDRASGSIWDGQGWTDTERPLQPPRPPLRAAVPSSALLWLLCVQRCVKPPLHPTGSFSGELGVSGVRDRPHLGFPLIGGWWVSQECSLRTGQGVAASFLIPPREECSGAFLLAGSREPGWPAGPQAPASQPQGPQTPESTPQASPWRVVSQ